MDKKILKYIDESFDVDKKGIKKFLDLLASKFKIREAKPYTTHFDAKNKVFNLVIFPRDMNADFSYFEKETSLEDSYWDGFEIKNNYILFNDFRSM